MGSTGRTINGIKFTPTEMSIIYKALDNYESTCITVDLLYTNKRGPGLTGIAADARKKMKTITSARYKFWRVSVGLGPKATI